jgi:hypothetical protein
MTLYEYSTAEQLEELSVCDFFSECSLASLVVLVVHQFFDPRGLRVLI